MGLFKKRSDDPGELDRLRSEISAMSARLDAADSEKAQLEQRVHQLATAPQQPSPAPPPPPEPVLSQGDLDMLRARIQRLYDRLDDPAIQGHDPALIEALDARVDRLAHDLALASAKADEAIANATSTSEPPPPVIDPDDYTSLRARVDALQARLDTPIAPPPAAPPSPPPAMTAPAVPDPPVALDASELADLRERIEALHGRVGDVDTRITSISTELANQLAELSRDVDTLNQQATSTTSSDVRAAIDADAVAGAVDEIRTAQERLANEQARYQIAFRHDLAELAERLRRG
jgi:tetrahydromethanopterin S-methyltransferase subunit G